MKVLQTFALPLGYRALEKTTKEKTHESEIVGIRETPSCSKKPNGSNPPAHKRTDDKYNIRARICKRRTSVTNLPCGSQHVNRRFLTGPLLLRIQRVLALLKKFILQFQTGIVRFHRPNGLCDGPDPGLHVCFA